MQTWHDWPDLVAWVFHLKVQEFLHEVQYDGIFGQHVASIFTVKYQKRGLPHIHFLLFLEGQAQFNTVHLINQVILAELPDPTTEGPCGQELYDVVANFLIHQPCSEYNPTAPCMKEQNGMLCCSKNFPWPFIKETSIEQEGYPEYHH